MQTPFGTHLSDLDIRVIGWLEGFIDGRRTVPCAAVGIELLGIHNPVPPVGLLKVHDHVHLLAEGTAFFSKGGHRELIRFDPGLLLLVAAVPAASERHRGVVKEDVFGQLHHPNEARAPGELRWRLVFGEDDQQDPVSHTVSDNRPCLLEAMVSRGALRPMGATGTTTPR